MTESILNSVKKVLGFDPDYEAFDVDILMHINTVFSTLNQLGIGPAEGFMIEDADDTWDDFLEGDIRLNLVKTYMCLRVKILFDPPTTGHHVDALKEQIRELEFRILTKREDEEWQAA